MPDKFTYLLIDLLCLAYPLAQSYEPRLRFLRNWRAIVTSITITGAIFIMWDELFTALGVWGFNARYILGVYLGRLPLEEVGFFVAVPFACLFVYEVLNYFVKRDVLGRFRVGIAWFFLMCSLLLAYYFSPKIYSTTTWGLAALLLASQVFVFRSPWLGRFFLTYFVTLVPFLVMNGWLTGAFTDEPIVWYNNLENCGVRIFTIPLEDAFYQLALQLLLIWLYEKSKSNRSRA